MFTSSVILGCVPLRWSGSRSVIRDHSDHGRSNEPMNPLWTRIHRFIWSTMIRMILDHWSWSGSSQRNAPLVSRLRARNEGIQHSSRLLLSMNGMHRTKYDQTPAVFKPSKLSLVIWSRAFWLYVSRETYAKHSVVTCKSSKSVLIGTLPMYSKYRKKNTYWLDVRETRLLGGGGGLGKRKRLVTDGSAVRLCSCCCYC